MSMCGTRYTNILGYGGVLRGAFFYGMSSYLEQIKFTLQLAGPSPIQFNNVPVPYQAVQTLDVGDQFVVFIIDENGSPVNIRPATSLKIKFLLPDGTTLDKTASLFTNGTDGGLYYTSAGTDLNQVGVWGIQAKLVLSGATLSTFQGAFSCYSNVDNS